MSKIKSLVKDTAIYGLSSIVGRFFNWFLVPFYTFVFTEIELGSIQNIYAYVAFAMVFLTFGMETTFFRFINKQANKIDSYKVYSTILLFVFSLSLLFVAIVTIFINPISSFLNNSDHQSYIIVMAITVAFDAFLSIPYAFLRYKKRPIKFATLKLLQIFLNIGFNLFFLVLCPIAMDSDYSFLVSWFYDANYRVGYTFLSNMIPSILVIFVLYKELTGFKYIFDKEQFKVMIKYSYPLVILGIIGIMNQTVDKLLYPEIFPTKEEGLYWLGIYTAGCKVAVVMTMFTQAFRFAYEPFVFAETRDKNSKKLYARSMTYFVLFALIMFLGISYYLEILKFIISPKFFEGIKVVPLIMIGELFFGIYFNLSIWFKLTDRTYFGAYISVIGCVLIVGINVFLVPVFGIIASAWANLACYLSMSIVCYFLGRKYFPIPYELRKLFIYACLCGLLYFLGTYIEIDNQYLRISYKTILLLIFMSIVLFKEVKLQKNPFRKRK